MSDYEVTIKFPATLVANLLCSAWEHGSAYWARCDDGNPYTFDSDDLLPLLLPVTVRDIEEDRSFVLDDAAIQRGLSLFGTRVGSRVLANVMAENADADDGDAFLQLCLFGELIYG